MIHTFLFRRTGKVKIEGVSKGWVRVGFVPEDLRYYGSDWDTRWMASDRSLRETQAHGVVTFTRRRASQWLMTKGTEYQDRDGLSIEICDRWLTKLFGKVPEVLHFRQTRMVG